MTRKARARLVKMVLTDVDGTLTDGTLTVLPDGEEIKSYHARDGLGVMLAQIAGLEVGIITGKSSRGLSKRAERLRITELHQGILDKKPVFEDILRRRGLDASEVAYIGDDFGDISVMRAAGLSAAVADAHPFVRKEAGYVCRACGGRGAFREFVEYIIGAQKKWGVVTARFEYLFDRRPNPSQGGTE
jgi:YrbI family 3-deoxy-D-manno-octulosonate 8-phosphate phosphatase